MASLAWLVVRSVTAPAVAVAVAAAAGVTSGLLLLSTRGRLSRMEHEVVAVREESECRWLAHRLWTVDRNRARDLTPEE